MDNVASFANFLGRDGALITKLVGYASSDLVSAEMIGGAWEFYKERSEGGGGGVVGNVQPAAISHHPAGGAAIPMENVRGDTKPVEQVGIYSKMA